MLLAMNREEMVCVNRMLHMRQARGPTGRRMMEKEPMKNSRIGRL